MKTPPPIAELAHELMLHDVVASETYLLYARMLEDWGYHRLAGHFHHESLHEREHATLQIDRLLYLGVPIDMSRRPQPPPTPATPRACLENSLAMEEVVRDKLQELCALCETQDEGTRELAERLLVETEMDHILWLRSQLEQIRQMGEPVYLAANVKGDPEMP